MSQSNGHTPATLPRELAMLQEASRFLAECRDLNEIKNIRDKAEALRLYMKQQVDSEEAQNAAAEIKLRAEWRAGELLGAEGPKRGGDRKSKSKSNDTTLKTLGISRDQSSRWQTVASLPRPRFEAYIADTKAKPGRELTTAGALKLAKQVAAQAPAEPEPELAETGDIVGDLATLIEAGRKFTTVYADPPWSYGNQATRASTDNHYRTMSVDEICAEPVAQVVDDNAHLHLWTTNAFLFDAKRVMEAWGFEYKSCFVWVKPQMGIGNYWRVSHEFMLFGLRGKLSFQSRDEMSWGEFGRTEHSAKPHAIREKVENVSRGPYLELYGRQAHPGTSWTVYGNQVRAGSRKLFK